MPIPHWRDRPDLYDYFDFPERPAGWWENNGIEDTEEMRQYDEERKARQAAERWAKEQPSSE